MIASRHDSANALHVIYNLPSRKCSRYIFSNLSLDLCFWRVLVGTPRCLFPQFALSCSFVVTLYIWCSVCSFPVPVGLHAHVDVSHHSLQLLPWLTWQCRSCDDHRCSSLSRSVELVDSHDLCGSGSMDSHDQGMLFPSKMA